MQALGKLATQMNQLQQEVVGLQKSNEDFSTRLEEMERRTRREESTHSFHDEDEHDVITRNGRRIKGERDNYNPRREEEFNFRPRKGKSNI